MKNNIDTKLNIDILYFINSALNLSGKEIGLSDTSCYELKKTNSHYEIKYGYRQSGSIELGFFVDPHSKEITIDYMDFFTQPSDRRYEISDNNIPTTNGFLNFGNDLYTKKYSTSSEIVSNPNALELLASATLDLNTARILGDCNYKSLRPNEELLTVGQKFDKNKNK